MMYGDFPELEATPMTQTPTPPPDPDDAPVAVGGAGRPITPADVRRVRHLDDAVADLVDIVRDHLAGPCTLTVPGLCIGETARILREMPPPVWYDLLCQALVREAMGRGQTPPYVHRILDAWISADPLDFERARVPDDVRDRVVNAVAEGRVRVRPGDPS